MKISTSALLFGALFCSSTAFAAIDLRLAEEVELIALNGEEMGTRLFKKSQHELDNGLNQIVVKVAKLVRQPNGEFEKFNSNPVVITFEASEQTITLKPDATVNTVADANQFNKKPHFSLAASSGTVKFEQELLPRGLGVTRDYEKEIARFNAQRNIPINKAFIDTQFSAKPSATAQQNVSKQASSLQAVQSQFLSLTEEERKQFLSWAVTQ